MSPLRDALTDVPGFRVGHWTDRRSVTGCTVVLPPPGAVGGVDVRGGSPGTRETDLLRPENANQEVHAVLLSGGSAFGLDAAAGVVRYLEERGIGIEVREGLRVPVVPAAILFDLGLGAAHRRPGPAEGYRAARRASGGRGAVGSGGAGTGATVAKLAGRERALKGGLGTASERLDTGVTVGAIVAVNALGAIRDPDDGTIVAGPRGPRHRFLDIDALLRSGRAWEEPGARRARAADDPALGNTTIGLVATDARLTKAQVNRLAAVAHDGLARTIVPAHTVGDGDTIFALAAGTREVDAVGYRSLEALATRAVERAVLRAVRLATGLGGVPSVREWRARRG